MRFTVKLRDLQPGELSMQQALDGGPESSQLLWEALKPFLRIPDDAWLATVDLVIALECVVPPLAPVDPQKELFP